MTKKESEFIWTLFEPFQGYGFNKAHAASYGKLAYHTAYMKANFPVAYMTAMLTAESGDVETIGIYVNECRRMGIEVLPPDVNESLGGFAIAPEEGKSIIDSRTIRFGLYTIKNLGGDISDAIIEERKKNGHYKDLSDFLTRVQHKNLNKKSIEALIKTGAMDLFGERGELLANFEDMLTFSKEIGRLASQSQASLFGEMSDQILPTFTLTHTAPATKPEKLAWEKELLGLYISGHPLDRIREKLETKPINIKIIKEELGNGRPVTIGGMVEESRVVITKNNDRMAFIKFTDFTGTIEAVVFPKLYKDNALLFETEKCLAMVAKVSIRDGEKSLIVENAKEI